MKFLIVEDHEPLRRSLCQWMTDCYPSAAVCEASTGEQAVLAAGEMKPDIVIMDVKLPGMDGFDAARCIKLGNPCTNVLIVTILEGDDYEHESVKAGASDFINKKDLESKLIPAIDGILNRVPESKMEAP